MRPRNALLLGLPLLTAMLVQPLPPPPPDDDRPAVLLALDRTWWTRWHLDRFTYSGAIRRARGDVVRVDPGHLAGTDDPGRLAARWLAEVHGLVLSGGRDVDPRLYGGDPSQGVDVWPQRDRFELALLHEALRRGMPVLGICRGHQLLNVALGGTLINIRDDPALHRPHRGYRQHAVELVAGSRLAVLFGAPRLTGVRSQHGQAIGRLGDGLRVVGRSADGIIEAVEGRSASGSRLLGVQWHPEVSPRRARQILVFEALVADARAYRAARNVSGEG